MRIFINNNDRHNAFRAALVTTAKVHKVVDFEFKANFELYNELSQVNSPLWSLLNDYFEAYDKWYDFYQQRKAIEQSKDLEYDLTAEEKIELAELATNRQDTLDALQNRYNGLNK